MMRQSYLQTAAVAALLSTLSATTASAEPVTSNGGSIQPFFGDIDTFAGDIDPFFGDIDTFAGDIDPFRGDIDPFYGDISPFWGDIDSFWGDIDPFFGDIDTFGADIDPFWGDIDTFNAAPVSGLSEYWSQVGPMWGDITKRWNSLGAYGTISHYSYLGLRNDFRELIDLSRTTWGGAVQSATGQSFDAAFANPILDKYGIDLDNLSTLDDISAADRSRFFLEWYDGLMAFSGQDMVDHWMPLVNWSPVLTQDQGEGHDALVGLLDVAISANDHNIEYLVNTGGYSVSPNEHGAAVASLIAARHDGQGVMGIAPRATILAYSPFDATGSASFADVSTGIDTLTAAGANVVNMSLGVPTWSFHQEIANIFQGASAQAAAENTVFVIASGNEGVIQTADVNWTAGADFSNLILVGSVDPTGRISFFSNTPGEACLSVAGVCEEENKLKYRFLVAPGENILVSDNAGGVTRLSGTSFAAPIVTGAISLIHDRWPWLQQHADETTQIIFQSAQDLGEEGVDSVYGHGLLDVEAAQSPLDFNNLTIYQPTANGGLSTLTPTQLQSAILSPGQLDLWEAEGAHIFAIETIGDTHRDFSIPLSSLLHGQSGTFNGNTERYQRHVYRRLTDWANGQSFTASNFQSAPVSAGGQWNVSMFAAPLTRLAPASQADRPYNASLLFETKDKVMSFFFGEGPGALALSHENGFGRLEDHDPNTGGVNPFLGLASGGAFAKVAREVVSGVRVAFGYTEVENDHSYVDEVTGQLLRDPIAFNEFRANAMFADVSWAVSKNVRLHAAFTQLDEQSAVLGAQGLGALSLDDGAVSRSITLGGSYRLSPRFSLSASATAGRTQSTAVNPATLSVDDDGLLSTSFQISAHARSLFRKQDRLTLSLAQPLHVERGGLNYESVQVVDRATGELGRVDEFWNLGGGDRHFITEAQYAFPLMDGASEISLFGRMDFGDVDIAGEYDAYAGGVRFTLDF
ncbi:MAG: S8 family peptidase [Pseudomonadota bacterium]